MLVNVQRLCISCGELVVVVAPAGNHGDEKTYSSEGPLQDLSMSKRALPGVRVRALVVVSCSSMQLPLPGPLRHGLRRPNPCIG